MTNRYRELRFYDGNNDRAASRLSIYDDRGSEFFMIVPRERGKSWRKVRDEALSNIVDAIERGDQPGRVDVETLH